MSITNTISKVLHPTAKHAVIGGIFTLALMGAIGLGIHTRQYTSAAVVRDSGSNPIDNADANGGVGAADPAELIKDIKANKPSDLATIYSYFGLTPAKYDSFISDAKSGTLYRDGHVEVAGQTVMTNAVTMGRTNMGQSASVRKPVSIDGKTTYYQSTPEHSFASGVKSLPVMVLFDNAGIAQTVIMNACGNPVAGDRTKPKATCDALVATQDKTSPNAYAFTARASFAGNAKFQKAVYHFSDTNTDVTSTDLTKVVNHTFTKDATVTVTVYATVPGGAVISTKCEKQIKHTAPMAVCTALVATAIDDQKQKFRFTVKVSTQNATLKSVDYTADANTTTGVTTKDAQGNVYKEYTFTDDKQHTVKATVHFTTLEGDKVANCEAKVTSKKTPMCTVPGHENELPTSENCAYCKEGIPKGDARCNEEVLGTTTTTTTAATLPNTGAGDVFGIFAGTSVFGALGHRFYSKRRASRAAIKG